MEQKAFSSLRIMFPPPNYRQVAAAIQSNLSDERLEAQRYNNLAEYRARLRREAIEDICRMGVERDRAESDLQTFLNRRSSPLEALEGLIFSQRMARATGLDHDFAQKLATEAA